MHNINQRIPKIIPAQTERLRSTHSNRTLSTRAILRRTSESDAHETMWQYRDRQSKKDSQPPELSWNSAGERVRLSQESGGSLRTIKRESMGGFSPTAVTREWSRLTAAIQDATSAEAPQSKYSLLK